ncbi:MAG: leucine-rich repeat domain-containing protein, partial [Bacillota bacterium]
NTLHTLRASGEKSLHALFGKDSYPQSYQINHNYTTYYVPVTLTTIEISASTVIVDYMAYGFISLSEVTYIESITSIGDYAFYNLKSLSAIMLPETLEHVGDYAFYNNEKANFTISQNNIEHVGEYAFKNCSNLSEFDSDKIEYIGKNAFEGCLSLANLSITKDTPAGVVFGKQMFVNSYQAEQDSHTYYIPSKLKTIKIYGEGELADYILANMTSLTSITLEGELEIPATAFENLTNVEDFSGEDIKYIGLGALEDMPWLDSYINDQPNKSMVYIGKVLYTYKGRMDIGYIANFEEDTSQLYFNAFDGQNRLVRVNINKDMQYIAISAFDACSSLNYIDVDENNEYYMSIDGILYDKDGETVIFTP